MVYTCHIGKYFALLWYRNTCKNAPNKNMNCMSQFYSDECSESNIIQYISPDSNFLRMNDLNGNYIY